MADTLKIRQAAFSGGEISPDLHGRTDLDTYAKSLKTCKNFIVTPFGTLKNRPGTQFLGASLSGVKARLIPFRYDAGNNFVLEFTASSGFGYIRVWKDGELQVVNGASGTVLSATAFSTYAKIRALDYQQVGDVMVITESTDGYEQPYVLEWDGATTWTLRTYGLKVTQVHPAAGVSALIWHAIANLSVTSSEGPLLEWTWKVAWVNSKGEESLPSAELVVGASPNHMCVMSEAVTMPVGVPSGGAVMQFTGTAGGNGYKVYRGVNDVYGLVGFLENTAGTTGILFQDDGREPDYTQQPVENVAPYGAAGPASSPDCVAYMDQRLLFGQLGISTDDLPRVVGSWLGKPYDWYEQTLVADDGPFDHRVAGAGRDQIRHLVATRDLLVLTESAEYVMAGAQRGVLGPLSVRVRPESRHGSSWLKPLVVNNSCLYVQDRGALVRDLFYDFQRDSYNGTELSMRARHLLKRGEIIDWTYAENPDSVVWMVVEYVEDQDDSVAGVESGTYLVGLTYSPEGGLLAWHQHKFAASYYPGRQDLYSVCAIPEGDNDTVYVCRAINLYDGAGDPLIHGGDPIDTPYVIEAMVSSAPYKPALATHLDSFVAYDGRRQAGLTAFKTSLAVEPSGGKTLTFFEDDGTGVGDSNIWAASGAVFTAGAYPAGSVGRHIILNPDKLGGEPSVLLEIITVSAADQVYATTVNFSDGSTALSTHLQTGAHEEWAFADHIFTGLDHLEGEVVYALVDGVKRGPYTVASGTVTMDSSHAGALVVIGLLPDAEIETLDAWVPQEPGFHSGKKTLAKVHVELDTADGLQVASSEIGTFKDFPDGSDRSEGGVVSTFDEHGRVRIRQNSPLPVTIRAIVREFLVED